MARVRPLKQTLSGGELSRLLDGQTNFAKYVTGCRIMENFLPAPQGPAIRRGATQFIAEVKDSANPVFPIPFERDEQQAYQIEMGDRYARFLSNAPAQMVAPTTDAVIANGDFSNGLTGWTDHSTGGASLAVDFIETMIPAAEGSLAGDMTQLGGLAAAFDGTLHKTQATCAAGPIVGYVAKDFGAGNEKKAAKIIFYGPSNGDFDNRGPGFSGNLTFYASNTSPADRTTLLGSTTWVPDAVNQVHSLVSNDINTPWRYLIAQVTGQTGGTQTYLSQAQFFEAADERKLALVGAGGGVAWAEQQVAVTTLGVLHVLGFEVTGRLTDKIEVRIGSTSQGDEILKDTVFRPGSHTIPFTPFNGPIFIQFRNTTARRVLVDDVILFSNAPIELATPYQQEDLFDVHGHPRITFAQFRDFLYLFHEKYPTQKMLYFGPFQWSIEAVDFIDGPYLDENVGTTTLTPSGATGDITITASAVTGINDDQGFLASDVGRLIRIKHGTWGAARILSVTSPTQVTAEVQEGHNLSGTSAVTAWRLGAWSGTTGYPACGTVNENRLVAGGGIVKTPHRYDMSRSFAFEEFSPSAPDGSVGNADAISRTLGAEKVQPIFWLRAVRDLMAGTLGAPFRIFATELNAEFAPDNTNSRRAVNQGVLDLRPIVANNNAILYGNRQGRRLMELAYRFDVDGYRSPDMTELAPHIFPKDGKLLSMDYAQQPESIVWTTNQKGQLASFSYERDQEIAAWARHPLGANAEGGAAEYVSVIPGPDDDQVWMTVRRTIGGQTKRYWEMLRQPLDDADPVEASFYVDCGLSLRNSGELLAGAAATLTLSATTGNGVTATAGAPVFNAGHVGRQIKALWSGSDDLDDPQLPMFTRSRGTIASYISPTQVTIDITVDFPTAGPIPAEWWFLTVTGIAGLDHLEGETIDILGDGGVMDRQTVVSGGVSLEVGGQPAQAAIIHAGYNPIARLVPTRVDAGVTAGTALVEKKRIGKIFVGVHRSAHFLMGPSMDRLEGIKYLRVGTVPVGDPEPLTNEIVKGPVSGGWGRERDIFFVQDKPLPLVLQIIVPSQLLSSDAGGP